MVSRSLFSSENTEFETPPSIFDPLDRLFEFNLDVCASMANRKCGHYITKADDALGKDWATYFGPRTKLMGWMNPPYGRRIGKWVHKAYTTWQVGGEVVALLPARTDTAWFQGLAARAPAILFIEHRVKFLLPCVMCGTKTQWLYSQAPSGAGVANQRTAGVPVCDDHRPTHPDVKRWCSAPFPSCLVFFLKAAPGVIANMLAPLNWGVVMTRISSPRGLSE